MLGNLKKLVLVSRPVSWPNTAYPFAAAFLVSGGELSPTFWVASLFFLIPYNLLMYGVNDVYDYESDIRNPRKGGLEGALEQKAFHPIILHTAALSTTPFVLYLLFAGSLTSNIILVTVLFFVIAYSAAGLRFKEIPVLDSITSSIHFVGPMVYALTLTGFTMDYIPYIVAFFLWGIASHAFGAVQDIRPDRAGGLASVATAFGAKTTMRLVIFLYASASVIIMALGWPSLLVGATCLIYVFNALPYISITDKQSGRANGGWRRFIWLNLFTGFVITMVLIFTFVLS